MNEEICSNCGRQISCSDQACVFDGLIVCSECDQKLRNKEDDSNKPSEVTAETCKICGRKIGQSERAYVVDGGIVCTECDQGPAESKAESFESEVAQTPTDELRFLLKNTRKGQEAKPEIIRSDSQEPCFFCGDVPSNESAFHVAICRPIMIIGKEQSQNILTELLYSGAIGALIKPTTQSVVCQKKRVEVPRCQKCRQAHDTVRKRGSIYLKVSLLFGPICGIPLAYVIAINKNPPMPLDRAIFFAIPLSLICLIPAVIVGIILSSIFGGRKTYEGVEAEKHAEKYHVVKEMKDKGWQAGERPKATDWSGSYIELPPGTDEKKAEELYKKNLGIRSIFSQDKRGDLK